MKPGTEIALAVFGSLARRDTDSYSDRDALVVGSDFNTIRSAATVLRRRGWSCSCFTWSALEWQARSGSLFVHHLLNESIIRQDPEHRLHDTLRLFSARTSYERDATASQPVLALLRATPRCSNGFGWAFDVLMTGFRTWAVPFLAEQDAVAYSYEDIVSRVGWIRGLGSAERVALRRLRIRKKQYRNSSRVMPDWEELWSCASVVERVTRTPIDLKLVSPQNAIIWEPHLLALESGYAASRLVERSLLAAEAISPKWVKDRRATSLLAMIAAPQAYARTFRASDSLAVRGYKSLVSEWASMRS